MPLTPSLPWRKSQANNKVIQTSLLLQLPGEIRNRIYDFLHDDFISDGYINRKASSPRLPAMRETCRQLYEEISPYVFANTPWNIDIGDSLGIKNGGGINDLAVWFNSIGYYNAQHIHHLECFWMNNTERDDFLRSMHSLVIKFTLNARGQQSLLEPQYNHPLHEDDRDGRYWRMKKWDDIEETKGLPELLLYREYTGKTDLKLLVLVIANIFYKTDMKEAYFMGMQELGREIWSYTLPLLPSEANSTWNSAFWQNLDEWIETIVEAPVLILQAFRGNASSKKMKCLDQLPKTSLGSRARAPSNPGANTRKTAMPSTQLTLGERMTQLEAELKSSREKTAKLERSIGIVKAIVYCSLAILAIAIASKVVDPLAFKKFYHLKFHKDLFQWKQLEEQKTRLQQDYWNLYSSCLA